MCDNVLYWQPVQNVSYPDRITDLHDRMFMQNLSLSPHFFKKSDGDIAIAFIRPPVSHAISS